MTGPTVVALGALLFALLLAMVASMVWQEAKRRRWQGPTTYVLDDAVAFVTERLPAELDLTRDDVQRILEWDVFYLQGLAGTEGAPVVGGDEAVEFVRGGIASRHRIDYDGEAVRKVLDLEAAYLQSIGAVGEPAVLPEEGS